MRLFSIDSGFYKAMTKMTDLLLLNFLWLLCSIPIVTIGASTTAAYYVAMKMTKEEEGYITKSYFKAFRENFKKSTILWLIMLFVGTMIWMNYVLMRTIENPPVALIIITIAGIIGYILCFLAVFPLTARYDNTVKQTIKNSLLITIRHFLHTLAMVAILAVFGFILFFNEFTLFFALIIGVGLLIYISSSFYLKIFEKVEHNQEVQKEVEEELGIKETL